MNRVSRVFRAGETRLNSEAQRVQRQRQLNAFPPAPGSILVTGEVLRQVLARRALIDHGVPPDAALQISGDAVDGGEG